MQNFSNVKFLPILIKLFTLLLVAKIIGLLLWWYLPSESIELNAKKSYQSQYQRVNFKNMLISVKAIQQKNKPKKKQVLSINSFILTGLYGNNVSGFAIIAKKSSPKKTTILGVGEVYEGYKLKEIAMQEVIFTKGQKEYKLSLRTTSKKSYINSITKLGDSTNRNGTENIKTVTKSDIKYYVNNPNRIWKDIAINAYKHAGKIVGFKIYRIKKSSIMSRLGLKKGDIMIRANNIKLTSYNDAINLYKKINTINTVSIVVLRNNQEKEIIYEIH